MRVYLGFIVEEYRERGGITDAVTGARSVKQARKAVEALLHGSVRLRSPIEGKTITVAEQMAAREHRAQQVAPIVTSTSDMRPIDQLRDIVIVARPAHVVMDTVDAYVARINGAGFWWISRCSVVDEGDWSYHFEWTDFTNEEQSWD